MDHKFLDSNEGLVLDVGVGVHHVLHDQLLAPELLHDTETEKGQSLKFTTSLS